MKKIAFKPRNLIVYLFVAYVIFITLNGNLGNYISILLGKKTG